MGNRKPLDPQTVLTFQGTDFRIESLTDRGANALVYSGWYPDPRMPEGRHPVLIRELFPYHPGGQIFRGSQGQIQAADDAIDLFKTHRQCFLSVSQAHLRLLTDHPEYASVVFPCFGQNETLYCIHDYHGGRTLQTLLREKDADLRTHTLRMLKLLDTLEAFHKTGILHLDITPDSIHVFGGKDQLFLLDHSCLHGIGKTDISYLRFRPGYQAPELETGDPRNAVFASDLYSVAAVFFRCLMGRPLSLEELLLPKAPDGQDSPCLAAAPPSARTMVGKILRKGLHELPEKRYRSTGQMRQAFLELLNRIDHAGVTSQALWEAGRRNVELMVRKDPALRRRLSAGSHFLIRSSETKESEPQDAWIQNFLAGKVHAALAENPSPAERTLFCMQQVLSPEKRYRPSLSPVLYLPLKENGAPDPRILRCQILKLLGILPDCADFQAGMTALEQLLQQETSAPVLVLLDDKSGTCLEAVLPEIRQLSHMPGIRILAASRSEGSFLPRVQLIKSE